MRTLEIPKGNGKVRTVFCPEPEHKRRLRALVPQLNLIAEALDVHSVQHGFTEGRSPVTNAKVHIGYEYSVCFDLKDFFDTVHKGHFAMRQDVQLITDIGGCILHLKGVRGVDIAEAFVHNKAVQGLPTSPALANIAAAPMDKEMFERFCVRQGRFSDPPAVMSRYADDITFSTDNWGTVQLLLAEIPKIVRTHGFEINPAKTKVQCAKAGRRIITGISVGEKDITIPRDVRRRLRAGQHQTKAGLKRRAIRRILFRSRQWKKNRSLRFRFHAQLKGLQEWALLKPPKDPRQPKENKIAAAARTIVRGVTGAARDTARAVGSFMRKLG